MRSLIPLTLLAAAGCQSTIGPFESRRPERADDPRLSTTEQKERSRSLYAFPITDMGPHSGPAEPDLLGPYNQ